MDAPFAQGLAEILFVALQAGGTRRIENAPMPTVELRTKRPRSFAAATILPCSTSLIITVGVLRLAKKLLTPMRTGRGTTFT